MIILRECRFKQSGFYAPGKVILVDRGPSQSHRYVTWIHNLQTGGNSWGHYFSDIEEATKDFFERARAWLEKTK